MKRAAKIVYHSARRQLRNLSRLATGKRVNIPSLASMTLDWDDVKIARESASDRSSWFDPEINKQYQDEFADWNGSNAAFSFMGGRVALSACLAGLNLQPGDEVIIPGYTCIVVPNAVRFAKLKAVFADIELETYGLDIDSLRKCVTKNTKAIILHHLFGLVCRDFEAILEFAKENSIFVIEDCAHATGCRFKGINVGNFGDAAFYSSEQSKIFNTVQGGMATTNDDEIASRIEKFQEAAPYPDEQFLYRQLKTMELNYFTNKDSFRWLRAQWHTDRLKKFRLTSTTEEEVQGLRPEHYGCKMPSVIARFGLNQLAKIDSYNSKRRRGAEIWTDWCDKNGYQKAKVLDESEPVFLRYPVMVEAAKKTDLAWAHKEFEMRIGVWFVSHLHPSLEKVRGCPNAELAIAQCINLPTLM